MKKSIIFLLCVFFGLKIFAQTGCPGCIIDQGFTSPDGMPGMNVSEFPAACQNQYYEQDATIYLPGSFTYSGQNVTLLSVKINSCSGVPTGLNWTKNGGGDTWTTNGSTSRGCFRLCGTPTTAGSVTIGINVTASVRVLGFTTSQDQSFSVPFTVNPSPSAAGSISGTTTPCRGVSGVPYSISPLANATSYFWTYSGTGATINGSGNSVTIDFSSSATMGALVVRGVNGSCTGLASPNLLLTIATPPAAAGAITGNPTACEGQNNVPYSAPYINGATSYHWSYSGTGATISGTGSNITINFAANATSGNLSVYGVNTCGNGAASPNYAVAINPTAGAAGTIIGPANVCPGQNNVSYSVPAVANATSYTWTYSGTGATIAGNDRTISINFSSGATSGTLTVKGHNNCGDGTVSQSFPITVDPMPGVAGTISGTASICQRQTNITYSVAPISNSTSYSWTYSGQGVTINGSGSSITADFTTSATSGAFNVKGHNNCGDGSLSPSFSVVVNPVPTNGTISGAQLACQGQTGVTYAVNNVLYADSYVWSYTGTGATIHGSGVSVNIDFASNATSGNLTVKGQNSCGDGLTIVLPINVITLPSSAGNITGSSVVCQGQSGVSYRLDSVPNAYSYVWEYSGTGVAIVGSTKNVTLNFAANAASGNLRVKGRNTCGDGTFSANFPITVNLLPYSSGSISGLALACQGQNNVTYQVDSVPYTDAYVWAYSGTGAVITGNTKSISINFSHTATPGNLTVKGQNACGFGTVSPGYTIILSPLPSQPGTISGPSTVCQGQTVSYSVPVISNASSYIWNFTGTGATINGSGRTISITFSAGATSGILTINGQNACGDGNTASLNVTLTTLPSQAGSITGTAEICQGLSGVEFHIDSIAHATSYIWQYTGSNVNINGTAKDITMDFGRTATSGVLTVKGQNLCGIGALSTDYNININPLPSTPSAIDGTPLVCQGQGGVAYQVAIVSNAVSYIWNYSGAGATISGTGNQVTVDFAPNTSAGTLTVKGRNACGDGNSSANYPVGVNLLPNTPSAIAGNPNACQGQNGIAYSIAQVANSTTYVWEYTGTGANIIGNGTNITIDFLPNATSGILTVKGHNNNCGDGAPSPEFSIHILTSLPQTPGSISGTITACQGQNGIVFHIDSIVNAQTYIWNYSGSGATISGNGQNVSVNFSTNASSGELTVNGRNTCGEGVYSPAHSITVNPLPSFAGSITGITYLCQGQTNIPYSVDPITNATSYTWIFTGTGATVNGSGNNVTINFSNNATSGNLTVSGHNACGDGIASLSFPIYFYPLPSPAGAITGDTIVCQGQNNVSYTVPGISDADYYIWTYSGTGATINGNGRMVDISFSRNAASGYLMVKGHNNCGNGVTSQTVHIRLKPLPSVPSVISGPATVCQAQDNVPYAISTVTNATSYLWEYSGSGAVITGNGRAITLSFNNAATPGTLTVKGVNDCGYGDVSAGYQIAVNPLPGQPGLIDGNPEVCQGMNNIAYSIIAIPYATEYHWSYSGSGGNVFGNTQNMYMNFTTNAASGNIKVYGSNACGEGPYSTEYPIIVYLLPASAGTISGTDILCQGDRGVEYHVGTIARANSYTWTYSGTGAQLTVAGSSVMVDFDTSATSGTLMVYGNNNCGDGGPSTYTVTLKNKPSKPIVTYHIDTLISNASAGNQWYSLTSGIINGATHSKFKTSANGKYFALVTIDGCTSDTSNIYNVLNLGIYDINNEIVSIYPDPVKDELFVTFENNDVNCELDVYNALGELMLTQAIQRTGTLTEKIDFSGFKKGLYFIRLNINDNVIVKKVIRQ